MTSNGQAAQANTLGLHKEQAGDTRARLIEAAIEVFGSVGYDGASTRQLADRASVNQAAIPYHFGGKRELYLAAAQAIADYMRARIDPLIETLRRVKDATSAADIETVVIAFFKLIAGNDEPDAWTTFFVRCEREADDAFRIIHLQAVARFQSALICAVAASTERVPSDEDLKIRTAIVLGAISNFRTLRNVMLNSLGWDTFDAERTRKLETAIRRLVLSELLGIRADDAAATSRLPGSAGSQLSPTA